MKSLAVFAGAVVALSATAAQSADLAARFPTKAPAIAAPLFTWTGFYAGINAGYTWSGSATGYDFRTTDPADLADIGLPRTLGNSTGGFTGGAQAGYNVQTGNVVVGLETDIQYLGGNNNGVFTFSQVDGADTANLRMSAESSVQWLGTLRGRAGVTFDRALFYATGGLAYGGVKSSSSIAATAVDGGVTSNVLYAGSRNETRVGYAVGAGMEYALMNNISVKAEYLHYDLGSTQYDVGGVVVDPADDFLGAGAKRRIDGDIVRAGLDFKLGAR